jgi:arsenate reductase-like glutaredoxin family protein
MFIRDLNQQGQAKIKKINKLLSEEFGMSIKSSFPKKEKLQTILEMSEMAIIKLKDTKKQFQLEPEYAKYLGIKDVMQTMIAEGMYAESPANVQMKEKLCAEVQSLMDGGCTESEAVTNCMVNFKKGPTAHSEEWALPIVMMAAKQYMQDSNCESLEEIATEGPSTDLNEYLLSELAKEVGLELTDPSSIDAIEEKLGMFAEVSGKSRDSVVGFLNGLEEDALSNGIKFFGAKVAQHKTNEATKFGHSLRDKGMSDEEIGKKINMSADEVKDMLDKTEKKNESMFDSIIDELLNEELEGTSVEEAEVVMAVRALADDIQDHVERLGRMVNEDIPAIADQMIHEFGADKAAQFKEEAETVLSAALDNTKQAKDGVNQLVGGITGQEMSLGGNEMGNIEDPIGADSPIDDMDMPEPEMDINEPAAAGPEEEPLGRAPVEG